MRPAENRGESPSGQSVSELDSRVDADLVEDALKVLLGRLGRHPQRQGDIPVPVPVRDELGDLRFPLGEAVLLAEGGDVGTDFADGHREHASPERDDVHVKGFAALRRQHGDDGLAKSGLQARESQQMIVQGDEELDVVPLADAADESARRRVRVLELHFAEDEDGQSEVIENPAAQHRREAIV